MLCGINNITVTKRDKSTVIATDKPLLVEKVLLDLHLNCKKKISKGNVEVTDLVVTQEFRDSLALATKNFFQEEKKRISQQQHGEKISKELNSQQAIQQKKAIEKRYSQYRLQLEKLEKICQS